MNDFARFLSTFGQTLTGNWWKCALFERFLTTLILGLKKGGEKSRGILLIC